MTKRKTKRGPKRNLLTELGVAQAEIDALKARLATVTQNSPGHMELISMRAFIGEALNAIRIDLERLEGCVRTVIDGQKQAGLHRPVDSSQDRRRVEASAVASALSDAAARIREGS